jgi:hypothetical protein
MVEITGPTRLNRVEHIIGSGTGVLDLSVVDESEYRTWIGSENADWEITGVERVENIEEDRFIIYPEEEYFICEIEAEVGSGDSSGTRVRCWTE